MRRSLAAGALLLAVYVGLSFLNSPRGFLGTDTGGKVATLEVMTRGPGFTSDPDLGYWASEWDPDGAVYPIYYSSRVGARWINVTTLPMLLTAVPLYDVGGYRLALLLPMLGGVAAAFAARALATRLGGNGWWAFWLVGVASPITVYALDFWEHSAGVAAMAWAVVFLWDVVESTGRRWGRALAAGLLFGLAATMRTETLVYVAAAGVTVGAVLASRIGRAGRNGLRSARPILVSGALVAAGFGAVVVVNELLERAVLGRGLRGARAAGIASIAGDAPSDRVTEAAFTLVGAVGNARGVVLGMAAVALFAYGVIRSRTDTRFGVAAIAAAGVLLGIRFADGLGFVPGLLVAWPVAIVALVAGGLRRWPAVTALVALPIVLATQFRGGAAPQWAGRYVLTTGLLLTIVGVVVAATLPRAVQRAITAAAVVVTTFGLVWMYVRTHDVDRAITAIEDRPEPVIVSTVAHLAREGGATYGERRWLTAVTAEHLERATTVVEAAGEDELVLVELDRGDRAEPGGDWKAGPTERLRLFAGVDLRVTSWHRTGSP